ncbi:hypothetical protein EES45_15520 [Streptomyces sp. ADI97-07]|nr:hypothetical protein EES45_15520 [Streptomyces sp. ADI97-07]
MGSRVRQWKTVRPLFVRRDTNSPFETAVRPSGTEIRTSYEALSTGWWFPGNQAGEPAGSPRATAPCSVLSQPSRDPSASVTVRGAPE